MRIAFVTNDDNLAKHLKAAIVGAGHDSIPVRTFDDAVSAQAKLFFVHCSSARDLPELLELLKLAGETQTLTPIVVILAAEMIGQMYRLRLAGASDVLLSPPEPEEIRCEIEELCGQVPFLNSADRARFEEIKREKLIGQSQAFLRCIDELRLAARSEANVLLVGETGTGKEMFSQALHALSRHTHFPFVAVNCAALSKHLLESELFGHGKGAFTGADHDRIGRFELVEEGTLLLDEIGDLEIPLQVKLLRVIEQRVFQRVGTNKDIRFKGRFISATCVDLDEAANNGEFRQDLLGRINQFRIKIPPLRERRGDVSLLSRHFLQKHAQNRLVELSPTALDVLEKYEFPRNIRQLENAIVFALARSDTLRTILPRHLPPEIFATQREAASSVPRYTVHISADLPYEKARKSALRQIDKIYLNMLLMKHNGNRSRAAEEAGIDRKTFSDRMDHTLENMEGPACDD